MLKRLMGIEGRAVLMLAWGYNQAEIAAAVKEGCQGGQRPAGARQKAARAWAKGQF
ncbi:hypothetical protein [Moorella stamsii]|uniref:hypothetical protein n=1 Tax=Neomoorella stamsii TaxID=1266720 RepID=UPI000B0FCA2E|nr:MULTISPECIES: hypothetical protein [Moorella]